MRPEDLLMRLNDLVYITMLTVYSLGVTQQQDLFFNFTSRVW